MKNLKLSSHSINNLEEKGDYRLCVDPVTKYVYIVNSGGLYRIKKDKDCDASLSKKWKECDIHMKKVVGAEVVTSINSICVVSLEGDVITVNLENDLVDVVGSVSYGVTASAWSPDQELLVLVTAELSVILMTPEFEPFNEFPLEQEDFGESKFITVGWGKKETQFHGKEGKEAAKIGRSQSTTVFEWDDRLPTVTWRGDGQLFAVGYVNSSEVRKFRVVNREGIIQSTSEDIEGLENCLCWKPTGSLIASSRRLSNQHNIVFFEKNGLQHGGFSLPFDALEMKINIISWNMDSTVLVVLLEPLEKKEGNLIQFWTVGNYHWYLKEELRFSEKITDIVWDPDDPLLLHLLTTEALHGLKFISCIYGSRGISAKDNAQVSVVDGKKLLITSFRQAVVPPPLSAYEVHFPNQIHSVIYAPSSCEINIESPHNSISIEDSGFLEVLDSPGCNCNNLCVFHGKDTLTFLAQAHSNESLSDMGVDVTITSVGGNGFQVRNSVHRVLSQNRLEWKDGITNVFEFKPENLYNWNWISSNIIVCSCTDNSKNYVIFFDLEGIGTDNSRVTAREPIHIEEEILTISSQLGSEVCLQLITGELLKLNVSESSVFPWIENGIEMKFPTWCEKVLLYPLDDGTSVPLGLTPRNRLYLFSTQLLSDCTSMHLHNDHLLLTTSSHNLLVVPKDLELIKSLSQSVKEEFVQIGSRRLERGSRIITAVPFDTKVVLQMPRGNLEVINPRTLAIHTLKILLDEKNYHLAFDIMRRQRIDLNLIYDHNPELFLNSIDEFIQSVSNPQWIDLFIVSLNNADVTQTCYASNYSVRTKSDIKSNNLKMDLVCEALQKGMVRMDEEKYLLPILSTYVKSSRDEIHLALKKLKEMKSNQDKVYKVSFEEGLRHLLYVSDENELCDVALGTYDFDLAMLIYGKSEKDPKEYLPFLNSLNQMEENYRKFKINVHLKRYKKALECVVYCEDKYNEECLSLIRKESLYQDAFDVFGKGTSLYYSCCVAYGDYLMKKGYENESAMMYSRGLKPELALKAYKQANNWRRVLVAASQLGYGKEEFNQLCYSLVDNLKSKNCFVEAASIYEKFIMSEEDAVECYCNAYQWEDAILLSSRHNRNDLCETLINPGILEQFASVEQEIEDNLSNFRCQVLRLAEVRSMKRTIFVDSLNNMDESQLDSDLYSDSSTVTGFSQRSLTSKSATSCGGRSYRSSKNKRKLDRKKYSTKEGSSFEDLGLIASLHDSMTSVEGLATTVSNLNRALVTIEEDSKARLLQNRFEEMLQEMKRNIHVIWTNCSNTDEEETDLGANMTTETRIKQLNASLTETDFISDRMKILEPHYRYPPNLGKIPGWKLFSLR